mmetsp:Transcript_20829/g.31539  ORF Transcript_20829/g.31539 Transcript_20829/m.31539 type:complete len:217 (-) Transcript_20829:36-686(-)
MKRKSPVNLSLFGSGPSKAEMHFIPIKPDFAVDHNPKRICTPSPTHSSGENQPSQINGITSIIRQSKRRKLAKYRTCTELVDWELDSSIATDYELILFSHMIMEQNQYPSFRCRLCQKSKSSTFSCQTIGDFLNKIPGVENHILECQASPPWLAKSLNVARAKHYTQKFSCKPYTHLVWKRVLAHAYYGRLQNNKRVKFSQQLCKEHLIPGRTEIS